jgi:hypothetical protein
LTEAQTQEKFNLWLERAKQEQDEEKMKALVFLMASPEERAAYIHRHSANGNGNGKKPKHDPFVNQEVRDRKRREQNRDEWAAHWARIEQYHLERSEYAADQRAQVLRMSVD